MISMNYMVSKYKQLHFKRYSNYYQPTLIDCFYYLKI
jgi:hypothetical protein